jgi:hypothetical protein
MKPAMISRVHGALRRCGPNTHVELHAPVIDRREERQAHEVVIVAVREQKVGMGRAAPGNFAAQLPDA